MDFYGHSNGNSIAISNIYIVGDANMEFNHYWNGDINLDTDSVT